MKNLHTTLIRNDSKHWIFFLVIGFLLISTGVYSLLHPFGGRIKIAHLMGYWGLLAGMAKVIFSIEHKNYLHQWKWQLLAGISLVMIGGLLFVSSGLLSVALPFLLSFWIIAVLLSLLEEVTDINLFHTSDSDWILTGSIATIVCLTMTAYIPILGSLTIIIWTSACFIISGVAYVYISYRLRSDKKKYHL